MTSDGAMFSTCRTWRYLLWRIWDYNKKLALFIGLNPSTANEYINDPTIRRCIGFAKAWGYGGILMANLFAYRATDPAVMKASVHPVGSKNDGAIERAARRSELIVCAWGAHGSYMNRDKVVRALLGDHRLHHLGLTIKGQPKHPLYLRADTQPIFWSRDAV